MRTSAFIVALACLFATAASAQVPAFITYSGRLTDGTGWGQSTQVDLTVTLYDAATGGKVVFRGKHLATMVVDGYFTVNVGMCDSNGACDPNPANAKFPSTLPAQMWIAVAVGSGPEMSPRQPIGSVPYSVWAGKVATISDLISIGTAQIVSKSSEFVAGSSGNPGPGFSKCTCSLAFFNPGTCGPVPGSWPNAPYSYGDIANGFSCYYNPSDGKIYATLRWTNQTGCHRLGVSWVCMK